MKKFILLFLFLVFNIFAKESYTIEKNIGIMKSAKGNFEVKIETVGTLYKFTISADTDGWVSIGFDSGFAMKNGELIICYNKNSIPVIEHHFGTSAFSHKNIINLMGDEYPKTALSLLSYEYSKGRSTYVFTRRKGLSGNYLKNLYSGKKIKLLYSYRKDSNINKKHSKAGSVTIILP